MTEAERSPKFLIVVLDMECTLATKHVTNQSDEDLENLNPVDQKDLQQWFHGAGWKRYHNGGRLHRHRQPQPSQAHKPRHPHSVRHNRTDPCSQAIVVVQITPTPTARAQTYTTRTKRRPIAPAKAAKTTKLRKKREFYLCDSRIIHTNGHQQTSDELLFCSVTRNIVIFSMIAFVLMCSCLYLCACLLLWFLYFGNQGKDPIHSPSRAQ